MPGGQMAAMVRQQSSRTLSSFTREMCTVLIPTRTFLSNFMAVVAQAAGADCMRLGKIALGVVPLMNSRWHVLTLGNSKRSRSGTIARRSIQGGIWTKWWWLTLWDDTGSLVHGNG